MVPIVALVIIGYGLVLFTPMSMKVWDDFYPHIHLPAAFGGQACIWLGAAYLAPWDSPAMVGLVTPAGILAFVTVWIASDH